MIDKEQVRGCSFGRGKVIICAGHRMTRRRSIALNLFKKQKGATLCVAPPGLQDAVTDLVYLGCFKEVIIYVEHGNGGLEFQCVRKFDLVA